jgi:type IV secretory pathway VirB2 component (pilin)
MPTTTLATSAWLAYHGTQTGGGNLAILFVFIGVIATVGWLIFSKLSWRNTVIVTVAGWIGGLVLTFGL